MEVSQLKTTSQLACQILSLFMFLTQKQNRSQNQDRDKEKKHPYQEALKL